MKPSNAFRRSEGFAFNSFPADSVTRVAGSWSGQMDLTATAGRTASSANSPAPSPSDYPNLFPGPWCTTFWEACEFKYVGTLIHSTIPTISKAHLPPLRIHHSHHLKSSSSTSPDPPLPLHPSILLSPSASWIPAARWSSSPKLARTKTHREVLQSGGGSSSRINGSHSR